MHKELIDLIMRHLSTIDGCNKVSHSVLDAAVKGNIDLVQHESDNRDRIINVIGTFQTKIEKVIQDLSNTEATEQNLSIVRSWNEDINSWIKFTGELDNKTTNILNNLKDQTTQEIGTIYKTKENVKGYNLSSVKK